MSCTPGPVRSSPRLHRAATFTPPYERVIPDVKESRPSTDRDPIEAFWFYGGPETGKSQAAWDKYSKSTHFIVSQKQSIGEYEGQPVVIFDDYDCCFDKRTKADYELLARLTEPTFQEIMREDRPPVTFTAKKLYVVSLRHPEEVFNRRGYKILKIAQRFKVYRFK